MAVEGQCYLDSHWKPCGNSDASSVPVPTICMSPVQECRGNGETFQYSLACKIALWPDVFVHGDCAAMKKHNCQLEVFPCNENSQQLLDGCLLLPYQSLIQVWVSQHEPVWKLLCFTGAFLCAGGSYWCIIFTLKMKMQKKAPKPAVHYKICCVAFPIFVLQPAALKFLLITLQTSTRLTCTDQFASLLHKRGLIVQVSC